MDHIIADFCQSVYEAADLAEQYQQIEHWAAAGETELLVRLAIALEGRKWGDAVRPWALQGVFDHIEVALALTPGLRQAEALLRLSLLARRATIQVQNVSELQRRLMMRPRRLACLLASAQRQDVLAELFARSVDCEQYAEILMLLAHEMVLRNVACKDIPAVVGHVRTMSTRNHPLGRLPLMLTEIETDLPLPRYHMRGASCGLPFGPKGNAATWSPNRKLSVPHAIRETTTKLERDRISSGVARWAQSSNGQYEARTFTVDPPLSGERLNPALLVSIGLDCLRGVGEDKTHLRNFSVQEAFGLLFAAASLGGAYPSEHWGAYGRYEAWRSLAGLVGAAERESIEQLLRRAKRCEWLYFDAQTSWFFQVAWDFGLVALRPDGKSLAVLAATDTD